MKIQQLLILAGLAVVGYLIYRQVNAPAAAVVATPTAPAETGVNLTPGAPTIQPKGGPTGGSINNSPAAAPTSARTSRTPRPG